MSPSEINRDLPEGATPLDPDEAALRLHHRLVQIHPFPNGNGRHARLWCDMQLRQIGRPAIDWGGEHPCPPGVS